MTELVQTRSRSRYSSQPARYTHLLLFVRLSTTDCRFALLFWYDAQDPTATNMEECITYVANAQLQAGGLLSHQSEHASFKIVTPKATVRLSHGRLHQIAMRDPTDQFDLPEHVTWQMNMGLDRNYVSKLEMHIAGESG